MFLLPQDSKGKTCLALSDFFHHYLGTLLRGAGVGGGGVVAGRGSSIKHSAMTVDDQILGQNNSPVFTTPQCPQQTCMAGDLRQGLSFREGCKDHLLLGRRKGQSLREYLLLLGDCQPRDQKRDLGPGFIILST
jgi:hypothetical protein